MLSEDRGDTRKKEPLLVLIESNTSDDQLQSPQEIKAFTRDVSKNGISIGTDVEFTTGEKLTLNIEMENRGQFSKSVQHIGTVRRVSKGDATHPYFCRHRIYSLYQRGHG